MGAYLFRVILMLCVVINSEQKGISINRRHNKRTEESLPSFKINAIQWRMPANAMRGMVSAELSVSDHRDYDVTWYYKINSDNASLPDYMVPVDSTRSQKVHTQHYWTNGESIISSRITFLPVPAVQEINLALEISTLDYGPWVWYDVRVPVMQYPYAQITTIHPELPEILSYPDPPVHLQPGDDLNMLIELKSDDGFHEADLSVMSAEVATSSRYELIGNPRILSDWNFRNMPKTFAWDQYVLTDVNINLPSPDIGRGIFIMVAVIKGDYQAVITIPILPPNSNSAFQDDDIHMQLEACGPQAKVLSDPENGFVRFEFDSKPNCIMCSASSLKYVDLEISRYNIPVGSGTGHAIYWKRAYPDVVTAKFVTYGQQRQSYSIAGNYTCSALSGWDVLIERTFEIITN